MKHPAQALENLSPVPGSFRDPKGRVARGEGGQVFRFITQAGDADFADVESSGLFSRLINDGKLPERPDEPDEPPRPNAAVPVIGKRRKDKGPDFGGEPEPA